MRPPRLLIGLIVSPAALLAAGLAVASADEDIEATEPVDPSVVVLEPGENLVGWVGDALPVDQLQRRFPEIESIAAWQPLSRSFYEPTSLMAGQGYVITLSGTEPVQWRRPMTPVTGKVTLRPGDNLVAWLGLDGTPLNQAVRGIGQAFDKIALSSANGMRHPAYDLVRLERMTEMPNLKRGDAVWVTVSRTVNWLQPTDISPTILFPGGASEEFKQRVLGDVAETLRFFRDYFAVEADYSQFTIYVPKDVDALVNAVLKIQPGLSEDSPELASIRSTFFKVSQGGGFVTGDGKTLVLTRPAWDRDGDGSGFTWGYSLTVHEYTHVLQDQLSRVDGAEPADIHQWMVEGNADWAQSAVQVWGGWSDWDTRRGAWNSRIAEFGTLQEWGNIYYYALGGAATNHLVNLASPDAVLNFWRLMAPISFGPRGRWQTKPTFEDAFLAAFDMSLHSYFSSFERSRTSLGSGHFLRGMVVEVNGHPLPYVTVFAKRLRDGESGGYDTITGRTEADGTFSLPVTAGGAKLGVDLGGCIVYHSPEGLLSSLHQAPTVSSVNDDGKTLTIALTDDTCVWQVSGQLSDPQGNGISSQWIYAERDDGGGGDARTGVDGTFSITVPFTGQYRLRTSIEGCSVYYRHDDAPGTRQQAAHFSIHADDVTDIRFQLTEGLCSTKITGRLLDADGIGIPDMWVYARDEDGSSASARTESDGSFSITVLGQGVFRLEVWMDGCRVYFRRGGAVTSEDRATRITIDERGVAVGQFQLRRGQCSVKMEGRVLDANGNAVTDTAVWAQSDDNHSSAQTDSAGSFSITVPEAGQYRVGVRVDGCTMYYGRNGVTGSWGQATRIRMSDSDNAKITLQLSEGMCEHRISGKLLNADGSPRSSQWVSASGTAGNGGATTTADGSFSFAVPANGSYRLSVYMDGCSIYRGARGPTKNYHSAHQARVSNADITGLEFRLPEKPSSFCS